MDGSWTSQELKPQRLRHPSRGLAGRRGPRLHHRRRLALPICRWREKPPFLAPFARLFFGAITLLVLYYAYLIIKPYLLDIFMALVLFFTARPLYLGLCRLVRRRALASAITCLILLLVILIPLFSLMGIIATPGPGFFSYVTKSMQSGQVWPWIAAKIDAAKLYLVRLDLPLPPGEIDLAQIVQTTVTKASAFIYTNAVGLIKGFTYFFFDLLLVLFLAFFMFLQGDDFIAELVKLSLEAAHNEEILRETEATIKATLWGTVIVAFIQGFLGGVGFLIFGVSQPAFWGTVMIPAAVIPIVGSALIWGPAAIYLLFSGHVWAGIGLIIWGGVLVSLIDNVLKPIIVKGGGDTPQHFNPLFHPGRHHLLRHDRLHPGATDPLLSLVAITHLPEDLLDAYHRGPN